MSAMPPHRAVFRVEETHGILRRPEHRIMARSDELGWSSLYASAQREAPYEDSFAAVRDHLIILHMDGPVSVRRWLRRTEERRVVPAGGLFIMPGGLDFRVSLEGELDSLHVYLRHDLVAEVAEELGLGTDGEILPSLGEPDFLVERLVLGVRDALLENDPGAQAYADYLSRALAARLLRRQAKSGASECVRGALSPAQLARVTDLMEAELDLPLSLEDMAATCGLSPSHFARRFKATTGAPPHQKLIQLRVERAKRLLQGTMPIAEVALACGFSHQEHLTGVFRRLTGTTPAQYRRATRN